MPKIPLRARCRSTPLTILVAEFARIWPFSPRSPKSGDFGYDKLSRLPVAPMVTRRHTFVDFFARIG